MDNNLIFKIDNEYWKLPDSPRILDRTESHVIFWQSLEYNPGNPVEFYEIPPLPLLKTEKNSDDSISFFLEGDDSYSMTILSNDSNYNDLYKEFCLDTFPGDYIKDSVEIAVYSDSYYQGSFYRDY